MYIRKIIFVLAIVTALTVISAGCVNNSVPEKVYIGCQNLPDCLPVAIAEDYLEEEMGVDVEILTFDAGRDITNALALGKIQFGDVGTVPATIAVADGLDAEVIWINRILGSSEALIAKDSENIKSVSDLRGKTVAASFSSTAHYSLLQALKLNGVGEDELTILDMPSPSILAAWKVNDIDAAYTWNPTLAEIQALGDSHIIIDSAELAKEGAVTADVTLVNSEFAKKYPQIVSGFVRAMDKAVKLYQNSKEDAVSACADYLNADKDTVRAEMDGGLWLSAGEQKSAEYLGTSAAKGSLVNTLKETADYLFSIKAIDNDLGLPVYENAVNPSFAEKTA